MSTQTETKLPKSRWKNLRRLALRIRAYESAMAEMRKMGRDTRGFHRGRSTFCLSAKVGMGFGGAIGNALLAWG